MRPSNRIAGRNVHVYNAKDPHVVLGGLVVTTGITNANFHDMLAIVMVFSQEYCLQNEFDQIIERDDLQLVPGKYYIISDGRYINA